MSDVHTPDGICVDWVGKKIYWSDGGYNMIEVAEFDGSNRLTLFNTGLDNPRAIAVDPLYGCVLRSNSYIEFLYILICVCVWRPAHIFDNQKNEILPRMRQRETLYQLYVEIDSKC